MADITDALTGLLQGLVGDQETPGFQGGFAFRQGLTDRKRRLATEQENLVYERARRLREDVAAQLDTRVREGQLQAQQRAAEESAYQITQRPQHEAMAQAQLDAARRPPAPRNLDPNSPEALQNRQRYAPPSSAHVPGSMTEGQQLKDREGQAEGALQGFFLRNPKFTPSRTNPPDMLQFLRHAGYGDLPEGTLYGIIQRLIAAEGKSGGGGSHIDLNAVQLPR